VSEPVVEVTLWVCDECGYYRAEERTGVHTATNPADLGGRLLSHKLKPTLFCRRAVSPADTTPERGETE